MIYQPGDNSWLDVVKQFERSAYRLEQQPAYLNDVHAGLLDTWLAGATEPPGPNDWSRLIASKTGAGATVERIRIVETPETPYQQWIRWYSTKNVEAGEQHWYLPRTDATAAGVRPGWDFWLLDDTTVVLFWFHQGVQTVETTHDERTVTQARRIWQRAAKAAGRKVPV